MKPLLLARWRETTEGHAVVPSMWLLLLTVLSTDDGSLSASPALATLLRSRFLVVQFLYMLVWLSYS